MRVALAISALLVAAVPLSACGSDSEPSAPPSELALFVPENPFGVTEVDLVALREILDLPPDADPAAPDGDDDAHRRFVSTAQAAAPFCHEGPLEPIDEAISEAIDCSQIRAAAAPAGVGLWSLTVLRTDQPFDEIADSLAAAGYERRGRLLNYVAGEMPVRYAEVIADPEDDSLIVLSRERTEGFAALGEGPADPESRPDLRALGALPAAPGRSARIGDQECVAAYAIADGVADERGTVVIELAGSETEAAVDNFRLDQTEGFMDSPGAAELFEFEDPEADSPTLRVPFTLLESEHQASGALAALDGLSFPEPYECQPADSQEEST